MLNLDKIAEELFNKIRGRYPKVTLGDENSLITNVPNKARFFDFEFSKGNKVNITVDEKSVTVLYNNELLSDDSKIQKEDWYGFMKELRVFAKKRMLNFDTRDITKTNLDKRDYQYIATNRPGEEKMSESKMYGTSRTSFQDLGNARLVVKHRNAVDQENPAGRTQQIDSIYIESSEGERFKYPYRHLNGARAMAMHVSEGGNAYDTFGKHIVSLSEELSKLRQFKTYMNRSSVMAEGLAGYMDIVNERIDTVKETVFKLQRQNYYKEAFESFEETVMEEVPTDVSSNWIDELTIRQFNEELKSVFPYIYNLVKENTKPTQIGPEDLLGEEKLDFSDKNKELSMWLAKYDEYTGGNGDGLPMGWIKAMTSTGIVSDGYEQDELIAFEKKIGKEESEWEDAEWDEFRKPENSPITSKMFADLAKIIGTDDHDEDVARAVSDALSIGEGETNKADSMNMEEADDGKKEQLQAWYEKYNKYDPADIGSLADGMFKFFQDSGVDLDTVEKSEYDALVAKHGEDKVEGNALRFLSDEDTPITKAMFDEFERIMGEPADEESSEKAVSLLGLDEGMNMEDAYASHLDNIVATSKHEQGPEQNEGSVPNYLDSEWKDKLAACAKGEEGGEDAVCDMLDKFDIPKDKAGDLIQKQIDKKFKGIGVMFKNPLKADPEWDNLQKLVDRLKGKSMGEGNEFAQKVQALKAKGAKPGTKFKTSDGEEHTLEDAIRLAGLQVEDFWTAEELVSESELPKSPKVLKLVIDDLKKFKAEQEEAKKQGYDEDVRMMQGRIDDMMDIANLIKDGGPIAALDTSVQDLIVDYYEKAGEPLPFAKEADDDTMDIKIDKDGALSKADAPDKLHDKEELPLDEFIKGHFDYTSNQFPKGETAVMTAVEKKYGDEAIKDAMNIMKELVTNQDEEMARIKTLAGLAH